MQLDPVDHDAATPPFEQVRSQIATRIASGALPSGTRLPTVRALAETLDLAVNTVARVYKELEADALVMTEGRRGTFVKSSPPGAGTDDAVTAYVEACRRAGLTRAEALRLVENGWSA